MCNAKPGHRCDGDSRELVENSIDSYAKNLEELDSLGGAKGPNSPAIKKKWEEKKLAVKNGAEKLKKRIDFYYSTNAAQEDGTAKSRVVAKMLSEALTDKEINALNISQLESRRVGKVINSFQNVFTETMKSDPSKSNLKNARMMVNGVFESHRAGLLNNAEKNYMKKCKDLNGDNLPKNREASDYYRSARNEYNRNVKAINMGYKRANDDAMSVVQKDCEANSQGYKNSIDKVNYAFVKNTNGTFTVTSHYEVEGKDFADVIERNEASYKGGITVQSTYKLVEGKKNTHAVMSRYVYKGGAENLADVEAYHKKVWQGTPRWRDTLAQVAYMETAYYK